MSLQFRLKKRVKPRMAYSFTALFIFMFCLKKLISLRNIILNIEINLSLFSDLNSYSPDYGCCQSPALKIEMNPIFIVFIVLLITLVGIFAWKKSFAKKGSDVLFMGLSDAGKTVLFSKLVDASSEPFTQTSIVSFL